MGASHRQEGLCALNRRTPGGGNQATSSIDPILFGHCMLRQSQPEMMADLSLRKERRPLMSSNLRTRLKSFSGVTESTCLTSERGQWSHATAEINAKDEF